ncbi:hypothetical protein ACMFMF_001394 [Clarireedia jacksonii]
MYTRWTCCQCGTSTVKNFRWFRNCSAENCPHKHCTECTYEYFPLHGAAVVTQGAPKQTICEFVQCLFMKIKIPVMEYIQPGWARRHGYEPPEPLLTTPPQQPSNTADTAEGDHSSSQNRKDGDINPLQEGIFSQSDVELGELRGSQGNAEGNGERRDPRTETPSDHPLPRPEQAHTPGNAPSRRSGSQGPVVPQQGANQGNVLPELNITPADQDGVQEPSSARTRPGSFGRAEGDWV